MKNLKYINRAKETGFTLVEMVIAISLLAIMLAAVVFSFDGARSRAQVMVTAMDEYGNAQIRMRTDIGCYAQDLVALLERPTSSALATTYCDAGGSKYPRSFSNWSGPYVKVTTVDNAKIVMTSLAPTIELRSLRVKDQAKHVVLYYVVADGVPLDIAKHAYVSCNGGEPTAASTVDDYYKLRCLPPSDTPIGGGSTATDSAALTPWTISAGAMDVVSIAYLYDKGRF